MSRLEPKKTALQLSNLPLVQNSLKLEELECIEKACTFLTHKVTTTVDDLRHTTMVRALGFDKNISNTFCASDAL